MSDTPISNQIQRSGTAIEVYYQLLESALPTKEFYAIMISMIQSNPYFFPPYLEMIDYLEVRGLSYERLSLLAFTRRKVIELLTNSTLRNEARSAWTKREGAAIIEILRKSSAAGIHGVRDPFVSMRARSFMASLPPAPSRPARHLIPLKSGIDVSAIRKEIARNEILWVHNTARQDTIEHHHDTNAIVLRTLQNATETFTPIDGPHESIKTPFATLLPHTNDLIESIAKELHGGLSRVALVRLKPRSIVYRHFDGEKWLKGRNRYHLVIQSKKGSLMTSGAEMHLFHEGDLFQFDNKVMHTAENNSTDWRIHAIFDMKVPA